jgi:hypothetical protein
VVKYSDMRDEGLTSLTKKSSITKQRLGKHDSAETNEHATEKLLETMFTVRSVLTLYNEATSQGVNLAAVRPTTIQLTKCSFRVVA